MLIPNEAGVRRDPPRPNTASCLALAACSLALKSGKTLEIMLGIPKHSVVRAKHSVPYYSRNLSSHFLFSLA